MTDARQDTERNNMSDLSEKDAVKVLQKKIGYRFKKKSLLTAAITHRSFRFENEGVKRDNQRLEFLGDAVIGFISAAWLYGKFSDCDEGMLTALRSQLTRGKTLAKIGKDLDLGVHLRIGKGEEASGGRRRSSNLADAVESVFGAVYLDGGLKSAEKVFRKLCGSELKGLNTDAWKGNPKGKLQELTQRRLKTSPEYRVVDKDGPAHASVFTVEVEISDGTRVTSKGRSKREAETRAAAKMLDKLGE